MSRFRKYFRCHGCRKHRTTGGAGVSYLSLTGKKRLHRFPKHKPVPGPRRDKWDRQYLCRKCGHTGWSNHIDLASLEGRLQP